MIISFLTSLMALGYIGVFLASLIGSASIIVPIPFFVVIVGAGAVLNPWLVGIAAALGATIGELTSYGVGYASGSVLSEKKKKYEIWFHKAEKWFEKYRGFATVVIFAATPLPFDIIGLVCGAAEYNIKKFLFATLIGKLVANIALAFIGFYGLNFLLNSFL